MTIRYQEASKAFAEASYYPFWQKIVFSFYGFGEYIKRIVWPFPLSAIHPFPEATTIPISYYFMIVIGLVVLALAWYFRNKNISSLVLVFCLQYRIGIAALNLWPCDHCRALHVCSIHRFVFAIAMIWEMSGLQENLKKGVLGMILLAGLGFAFSSFQHVKVWKDAESLWTNAIQTYPDSYMARSNRGQFLAAKKAKYEEALADYAIALKAIPNDSFR